MGLYDRDADRILANIQSPPQVAIIDGESMESRGAFQVPSDGPHGLDVVGDRIFCAADGRALVVLDRRTGRIVAALDLPGVPDVVMGDASLQHLYVAIGDPGVVAVFDTETLTHVETVATERGAHTLAVDSTRHAVYVFMPTSCGAAVFVDSP